VTLRRALLACALFACAPGCGKTPQPSAAPPKTAWGETPLVRVGQGVITLERFRRRVQLEQLQSSRADQPPRDRKAILAELIDEEILIQQALDEGILADDPDVRDRVIARLLLKHQLDASPRAPSPETLRAFYLAHRAEFPDEERYRIAHILIKLPPDAAGAQLEAARATAEKLRKEALRDPSKFADLARARSADPSAARGGDLGWLPYRRLLLFLGDEFAAALPRVAPGGIGDVVRSRYGLHVFRVLEKSAPDADPLVVQGHEIAGRYLETEHGEARARLVSSLRAKYSPQIDQPLLDRAGP